MNFPLTVPAIKINQPMGTFFAVSLPAHILLDVCFSDLMRAERDLLSYTLTGTQRVKRDNRLQQIAEYIDRTESAFPNAIILAANYHESGYTLDEYLELNPDDDDSIDPQKLNSDKKSLVDARWKITSSVDGHYELTIPSKEKLAAIIDGQHRLFAFASQALKNQDRRDMDLLCSIYLDLPKAYQAQLFAIINSTQKPVDKSLTFELYGYNISEEKSESWTPDKLAVFFSRKLATEQDSPLCGRIKIAAKTDEALTALGEETSWKVSTAVIVEGIMKLISSNPTRDSNVILGHKAPSRSILRTNPNPPRKDKSVLREAYINCNDTFIYTIVLNFLKACDDVFWKKVSINSFITKTVGIQALFDILRLLVPQALNYKNISEDFFNEKLSLAANIDFTDSEYNASGSGRSKIRRSLVNAIGLQA
jgi:DNA phosphorothioation-associated DGQHR protein 1